MASFVERVVGAARLDIRTYEEVEADASATPQAMGVVVLVALASGIGALSTGGTGVVGSVVAALVGWAAWAAVIWLIGTELLPEGKRRCCRSGSGAGAALEICPIAPPSKPSSMR